MSSESTRPSAVETAYAAIKEWIVNDQIRQGSLISAVGLAEQLGMSRTPTREALVRLAEEGFVELSGRRGAIVLGMSATEVRDVIETRHALEVAAAGRLAAAAPSPARLRDCDAALELQRRHLNAADWSEFAAADEAFHVAIVAASGNTIATRMYRSLKDRQRRMIGMATLTPVAAEALVEDHARLLELLLAGDVEAFADAHWEHVVGTHRALLGNEDLTIRPVTGVPGW